MKQCIVPVDPNYLHILFCILVDCPTTVIDKETLEKSAADLT